MIRFALFAALAGCSYDATLGLHVAHDTPDAGAPPADAIANLAYARDMMFGPILADGTDVITIRIDSTNNDSGTLVRVHPDGTVVPIADGTRILELAQDDTTLYALELPDPATPPCGCQSDDPGARFVVKIDKATGATATLSEPIVDAFRIAVGTDAIYVARHGEGDEGGLVKVSKTGGPTVRVFDDDHLAAVVLDSDYAYAVENWPCGRALAIPLHGGAPLELATNLDLPIDIQLAGDDIYVTEEGESYDGGSIIRVARPAAHAHQADVAPFARIVTDAGAPFRVTFDDDFVYWTSYFWGLDRAPRAGGPAELRLASGIQGNDFLAVVGDVVLFTARHTDNTDGLEYAVQR